MTQVEVDEMLRFMSNKATKVPTHDAVPGRALSLVECSLDMLRNVLLDSKLAHGFLCNIDRLLLHVLGHIRRLDLSFKLIAVSGRRGRCLFGHGCSDTGVTMGDGYWFSFEDRESVAVSGSEVAKGI